MNRPTPSEYPPFFHNYIQLVPDGLFMDVLATNTEQVKSFFASIDTGKHDYRYKPDKWSIKEILLHMVDTERVMAYRILTIGRGDVNVIFPGMDEKLFAAHATVAGRTLDDLLAEFVVVRENTTFLLKYMPESAIVWEGRVMNHAITPSALGYIIAGHALHHLNVIRDRYL